MLFGSYASVTKLEKQLDDIIRTSSSQDETLLQMEQELAQKKRELKQQVLAHYKPFVDEGMHKGYTDEVRECFTDIQQHVSAKNISKVVTSVLSILGKFDVTENDFPKSTFCKLVRQEANILSSRQVGEELLNTTYATQHSDGTSRNGQKVVDHGKWSD